MWKVCLGLVALVALATTSIAAPITVDAPWSSFSWGSDGASSPVYDFASAQYTFLDVTDDFLTGDVFEVYDFGVQIGTTSTPAGGAGAGAIGPDAAFADADYSSGTFFLAPGAHSISFITNPNPFDGGAGWVQVRTPEPATFGLFALGAFGVVGLVRRRRRAV